MSTLATPSQHSTGSSSHFTKAGEIKENHTGWKRRNMSNFHCRQHACLHRHSQRIYEKHIVLLPWLHWQASMWSFLRGLLQSTAAQGLRVQLGHGRPGGHPNSTIPICVPPGTLPDLSEVWSHLKWGQWHNPESVVVVSVKWQVLYCCGSLLLLSYVIMCYLLHCPQAPPLEPRDQNSPGTSPGTYQLTKHSEPHCFHL